MSVYSLNNSNKNQNLSFVKKKKKKGKRRKQRLTLPLIRAAEPKNPIPAKITIPYKRKNFQYVGKS